MSCLFCGQPIEFIETQFGGHFSHTPPTGSTWVAQQCADGSGELAHPADDPVERTFA